MERIIMISVLTLIAVITYIVLMQISTLSFGNKRKRLSSFIQDKKNTKRKVVNDFLVRTGIRDHISPSHIMFEAEKYGKVISKQSFLSTFLLGTIIGVVIFVVYLEPLIFLLPLSVIGGIIATNIRLQNIRKQYYREIDSKLSIYMSALSTAMGTFHNIKDSIQSILPSIEFPVREHVEEALIRLQDGKSVKEAFENMNNYYSQKYVRLFHDKLDVMVKGGTTDITPLRTIAFKMKRKQTYRRKLETAYRQNFKLWRAFVILSLSVPFLFIFASMDNYRLVMTNIISSFVFIITFILIFVTYRQVEKLEIYDPTADENIKF